MFRILQVDCRGGVQAFSGADHVAPPPDGSLRWIDLMPSGDGELQLLKERFGFHPHSIEDCEHVNQRPKLEDYGDHFFLVTHAFQLYEDNSSLQRPIELHSFLGSEYLVTVHDDELQPLDDVWARLESGPKLAICSTDFIRYLIADAVVDAYFPVVDHLAAQIEKLEDGLLAGRSREGVLDDILQTKRLLVSLRRVLPAQRDVLIQLSKRESRHICSETLAYYRDVYDHLLRILESVEANRELLGNVLDAYQWTVSQRTNDFVKQLTLVSAVFLPLTFITGFFEQNFEALPFESNVWMLAMVLSCVAVPAAMLWFFLRSKWF